MNLDSVRAGFKVLGGVEADGDELADVGDGLVTHGLDVSNVAVYDLFEWVLTLSLYYRQVYREQNIIQTKIFFNKK